VRKEKIFFPILMVLLLVGISGIPIIYYSIYAAPVIAVFIMVVKADFKPVLPSYVRPFLLLLLCSLFTLYKAGMNWARQTYFILAYTTIFIFYDFSRVNINIKIFNLLFVFVFMAHALLAGDVGVFSFTNVSLIDSSSVLESTLAFPLGLFANYFLY
jgi:hypothetical protein